MTLTSADTNANELTAQEAKVSNLLSLAWNEFCKLARDDAGRRDFLQSIQAAQYLVLAGPGIRQLNSINLVAQANAQEEARAAGQQVQEQVFDTGAGEFIPATDEAAQDPAPVPPRKQSRRNAKEV